MLWRRSGCASAHALCLLILTALSTIAGNPTISICSKGEEEYLQAQCGGPTCTEHVLPHCCQSGDGTIGFRCQKVTGDVIITEYHNNECAGHSLWRRRMPTSKCLFGLPKTVSFQGCPITVQDKCFWKKCEAHQTCHIYKPTGEPYCADTCNNNGMCESGTCELMPVECPRQPCPAVARCIDQSFTLRPAMGDCFFQNVSDILHSETEAADAQACATRLSESLTYQQAFFNSETKRCFVSTSNNTLTCQSSSNSTTIRVAPVQDVQCSNETLDISSYPSQIVFNAEDENPSSCSWQLFSPANANGASRIFVQVQTIDIDCSEGNLMFELKNGTVLSFCGKAGSDVFTIESEAKITFPTGSITNTSKFSIIADDRASLSTASEDCLPWNQGGNVKIQVSQPVACERACLDRPLCHEAIYQLGTGRCFLRTKGADSGSPHMHSGECQESTSLVTFHREQFCDLGSTDFLFSGRQLQIHMTSTRARGYSIVANQSYYVREFCVHTGSANDQGPTDFEIRAVTGVTLDLLASTTASIGDDTLDTCFSFKTRPELPLLQAGNQYLFLYHRKGAEFSMKVRFIHALINATEFGIPVRVDWGEGSIVDTTSAVAEEPTYFPVFRLESCSIQSNSIKECPPGIWGDSCDESCTGSADGGVVCSGHGTCRDGQAGDGTCKCFAGWAGNDCSVEASGGSTWPCTSNGVTFDGRLGDGTCECFSNDAYGYWTGTACDTCIQGFEGITCKAAICGDSIVQGLEECDDGNLKSYDCCDNKCKIEAGCSCTVTEMEPGRSNSTCDRVIPKCEKAYSGFIHSILGKYEEVDSSLDASLFQEDDF